MTTSDPQVTSDDAHSASSQSSLGDAVGDAGEHEQCVGDIRRLEAMLAERSAELRELREELGRREALVRDLLERHRRMEGDFETSVDRDHELHRLREQLDAAVAREVGAEAARLEAALRLDEVSGRLLGEGTSEPSAGSLLEERNAELWGTVRGLRSRIAELEEARGSAEARQVLGEHDLEAERERALELERQLEVMRERLEAELSRARSSEASEQGQDRSELAAVQKERNKLAVRVEDTERSLVQLLEKSDADTAELEAAADQREALRAEVAQLRAAESVLKLRISEGESSLAEERQKCRDLEARGAAMAEELDLMRADLASAQHQTRLLQASVQSARAERDRVGETLQSKGRSAEERAVAAERRSTELAEVLAETRGALAQLSSLVGEAEQGQEGQEGQVPASDIAEMGDEQAPTSAPPQEGVDVDPSSDADAD